MVDKAGHYPSKKTECGAGMIDPVFVNIGSNKICLAFSSGDAFPISTPPQQ